MSMSLPRIGILNFDAHFDLRHAERASSGTPFRQIAELCQASDWPFAYCCLGISRLSNTAALFDQAQRLVCATCWTVSCSHGTWNAAKPSSTASCNPSTTST